VKFEDIESLIRLFESSDWDGLRISGPDCQIHVFKDPSLVERRQPPYNVAAATSAATRTEPTPPRAAPSEQVAPPAGKSNAIDIAEGMVVVRAPNLGTFYRAPKPGADPYVTVGQRVEADTEVCVIEVMKLFTAVRAGVAGIVRQVLVADGQMVEFDQPLFVIEPMNS